LGILAGEAVIDCWNGALKATGLWFWVNGELLSDAVVELIEMRGAAVVLCLLRCAGLVKLNRGTVDLGD
jgi:hypothetical protein